MINNPRRAARIIATINAIMLPLLVLAVVYLVSRDHQQDATLTTQGHAAIQQNVNARFDDCQAGDQVRAALYAQTLEAQTTTNKVLFKLVPALNTPEVRAIVARDQVRELHAFRPRGTSGCARYAIKSVPPKARGQYTIPKP